MSKPTVSLLGATYSDVSGVELPKSGGGTALFPFVEGSDTVTTNGTYDVTALASLVVNVSGGGGSGLAYESGTWTPTADTTDGSILFSRSHSEAPVMFTVAWQDDPTLSSANTMITETFVDFYKLFGLPEPYGHTGNYFRYAIGNLSYENTSNGLSTSTGVSCSIPSDNPSTPTGTNFTRWFMDESGIYPRSASATRYWRAGRTYKWIAIWK